MVDQATRDRLDDAVHDAMAAIVNRLAMRDEADERGDFLSRAHHDHALIVRCRELKAAYDKRADALGYDRSKAR